MRTFSSQSKETPRIVYLDFIRVMACYMVIIVHSCEFFYIGPNSTIAIEAGNGFWVNLINSAVRSCVPLFVMVSATLLLPLKESPRVFFKKRFTRVIVPFIVWSILYAVLPLFWNAMTYEEVIDNLLHLTYNFNMVSGHLWFVYMLIGIYLFMPVISPWLKETSKKFEIAFLIFWFLTTFYHYIKLVLPEIMGECYWNEFTPFWYFSGYIGYVVLAHYIRSYIDWDTRKSIIVGTVLYLIGYASTYTIFDICMDTAGNLGELELSWRYCTPNIVLMATGIFLIMKKIKCRNGIVLKVIQDISKLSYGIYLIHIFILGSVFYLINDKMCTPAVIFCVGTITFVICYGIVKILSYIPKSKYIIG